MVKVVVEPRRPETLQDEAVARYLERVAWLMLVLIGFIIVIRWLFGF